MVKGVAIRIFTYRAVQTAFQIYGRHLFSRTVVNQRRCTREKSTTKMLRNARKRAEIRSDVVYYQVAFWRKVSQYEYLLIVPFKQRWSYTKDIFLSSRKIVNQRGCTRAEALG